MTTTTTTSLDVREQVFFTTAAKLGADPEQVQAAWDNLSQGRCVFLVFSGKMGSGKDTLAPLVLDALSRTTREHLYYANALKDEADAMFELIRDGQDAIVLADRFNMSEQDAHTLCNSVRDDLANDPTLHSRNRSTGIRAFLQILGTDVRRKANPDYWVNLCMRDVLDNLSAGNSVFLTDARFPNEIDVAQQLGAFAVRLDITSDVQRSRLLARDGELPEESAFAHPSETALDEFVGYDLVIDNNNSINNAVVEIANAVIDANLAKA